MQACANCERVISTAIQSSIVAQLATDTLAAVTLVPDIICNTRRGVFDIAIVAKAINKIADVVLQMGAHVHRLLWIGRRPHKFYMNASSYLSRS